ncbi:MAG: CHAT domain-containing protein [Pseudomonadota bacterium]
MHLTEVSSVQLMENLFRHIKQGRSIIEAVQSARKEIREAGFDHPLFWAPFILVGECN